MVKYTAKEMRELMSAQRNIRNMSVVAHVDHGKTTLTDSLVSKAGIISEKKAGQACFTDGRPDEQQMGITIKSTAVSMCFELPDNVLSAITDREEIGNAFLVNLIDSPGHIDFSSEVSAALRVSDGAMVVVDCVSGVRTQTETVLRQALGEWIKPVLFLNKLDRAMAEQQLEPQELYIRLRAVVEHVNALIATYSSEEQAEAMGGLTLDPSIGNVGFGSGFQGWGFTLRSMAELYASKFGIKVEKLMRNLWGERYFDSKTRKWTNERPTESSTNGFVQFVLEPIYRVLRSTLLNSEDPLKLAEKLSISLSTEERLLKERDLLKLMLHRWLPASDAMVELICVHLPSPITAQRYRTDILYEGPMDDAAAIAMKTCDPNGPLMMYVSKMVPAFGKGRFYAFGRVFSGTVTTGMKARIQGPNYVPGGKSDLHEADSIQRVALMIGQKAESVNDVPCGNVCALIGVDKYLVKTGTITTFKDAHNLRVMKFSVSPVVRVAVQPADPKDLGKLVEGLKRLAKSDPMVQCIVEESGEHVVAGAGELHLQICLKDLEEDHAGVKIKRSDPVVSYRETVTGESAQMCLAKSANKLNRLFMKARPLPEGLAEAIDIGDVAPRGDTTVRSKLLHDQFGMDTSDVRKIWCFAPDDSGPNIVIDSTKACQHIQDIREAVCAGAQWALKQGPLGDEPVRGVRFDLYDAVVHSDSSHRGGSELLPATRRCMFASMLTAGATLFEPIYAVEIQCPESAIGAIYRVLNQRRGHINDQSAIGSSPMFLVKAFVPVNESFGMTEALMSNTSGQAHPQCTFDHWQVVPGSPTDVGTLAGSLVQGIRRRKGARLEVPDLSFYLDKL